MRADGFGRDLPGGVSVPAGRGWVGGTFATGDDLVFNDFDEGPFGALASEREVLSETPVVLAALQAAGEVVGVLSVSGALGKGSFGPRELECISLIRNFAGTAIRETIVRESRDRARDLIVLALATLAENRDSDTGRHLERVTRFSLLLARRLRGGSPYQSEIDEAFLNALERAVPLHDIGKVAIPDSILLKAGRLTPEEMSVMKSHTEAGWRTIRTVTERMPGVPFLEMAADIAYAHHERYDGTGYPRGLSGQDIPLAARIAAVADVYDALTTQRSYKPAFPHRKAAAIIEDGSASQFDSVVVDAFRQCEHAFADLAHELADNPTVSCQEPREECAYSRASI
jgi:HD-GYP domain-containing protein (c-di-GMP phosphodiesterase class II)